MRVSVLLDAILIFGRCSQEQTSWNIFRNIFLFLNIPNERVLNISKPTLNAIRLCLWFALPLNTRACAIVIPEATFDLLNYFSFFDDFSIVFLRTMILTHGSGVQ